MVEEEEPKEPTKRKDQIKHDEELAKRLKAQLQAEMEEEDMLARQREEEDNIVSWDNAQAMMEADYQMAERLHSEEQASLTDEQKASLFVQLLDTRKKHFAALRAQEIRNKPPTKKQKRTIMCNYLKNMAGYKHNQLRHKSFADIQKLFDKALKRVNTFVPMDTEKVEGSKAKAAGSETRVEESSKRAGEELDRESIKKQKVEDETEQAELKECCEIIPFDEDVVNTIPLATKQAPIVDYKITRDARKIYYHITRADGSTQVYMRFEDMLKMFDREDLEVLYRIVKDRFKSTKPVGDNIVLWGNLMTMFEPSVGDEIWREQRRYLIKSWSLLTFLRHKQVLKTKNLGKRIAFLENEHSKSFAKWLCKEVERELAISKESVSETVRWISYGPRATVVKYDAYNINGYTFRTKCHDGKVYQNSGVSVIRKSK
ncbi:hypothetical protein Tco_0603789 [Tanacetum coccineum]